jgi:DNA-binding protein HU-beta
MLERDASRSVTWTHLDGNPAGEDGLGAPKCRAAGNNAHPKNAHPKEDSMATKAELIDAVADSAGVSKADAERTLGAFFDHVVSVAQKGEKVAWPGFGSFSTTKRSARTGRNPQTGAPVKIGASTALKFTASSTLKAALNPGKK